MQGHLIGSVCPFFSLNSGSEKKVFHFKKVDTSNGASKSKLLMVLEVWGQAKGKMPRKKGLNLNFFFDSLMILKPVYPVYKF